MSKSNNPLTQIILAAARRGRQILAEREKAKTAQAGQQSKPDTQYGLGEHQDRNRQTQ